MNTVLRYLWFLFFFFFSIFPLFSASTDSKSLQSLKSKIQVHKTAKKNVETGSKHLQTLRDNLLKKIKALAKAQQNISDNSNFKFKFSDYNIINWPRFVSFQNSYWDERTINEIQASNLIFIKRADNTNILSSHKDEIKSQHKTFIKNLLYEKFKLQTRSPFNTIKWLEFHLMGWPIGVTNNFTYTEDFNQNELRAIYLGIEEIKFVPILNNQVRSITYTDGTCVIPNFALSKSLSKSAIRPASGSFSDKSQIENFLSVNGIFNNFMNNNLSTEPPYSLPQISNILSFSRQDQQNSTINSLLCNYPAPNFLLSNQNHETSFKSKLLNDLEFNDFLSSPSLLNSKVFNSSIKKNLSLSDIEFPYVFDDQIFLEKHDNMYDITDNEFMSNLSCTNPNDLNIVPENVFDEKIESEIYQHLI